MIHAPLYVAMSNRGQA